MTVAELKKDPSFQMILMLGHDDILPFVEGEFSNRSFIIKAYIWLNVILLASIIWLAIIDISADVNWVMILKKIGLGALLTFSILIPIHELLHGLAYKICGALSISFGVNWGKFYFYAVADHFVANRKSFTFIALLPFVVISVLSFVPVFFVGLSLKWTLLGVLFFHTTACAGDFAMLGFYEKNSRYSKLLTYDDVAAKKSYFFVKE